MKLRMALVVVLSMITGADVAWSQSALPPQLKNVGFDQRLDEQVPLDLHFKDETGRDVKLGDYFHGKPVILVLAYYRCPMLCTMVLNGLVQGMLEMNFNVGREFEVVTVSFDPREKPPLAAEKKAMYLTRYGRPGAAEGWHFLTGEEDAIQKLTQAVGFRYRYDPASDQFAHATGIMVLTPEGKISRYFYDVRYSGRDLRLALVEASANKIGSPVDQVLLFCFHYDPTAGKYGVAIMNFVRLGGVFTVIGLFAMFAFLRRGEKRRRRASNLSVPPAMLQSLGSASYRTDHIGQI
jgi:protein SCO1